MFYGAQRQAGDDVLKPDKELLKKYNAYHESDSAFAACGRLLQSMWRKRRDFPEDHGRLGNYLPYEFAKETKANFLTDRIKALVQYEVYKSKSENKFIQEPRIWDNLLSSQPLCFNLFGEMHFDLKLASRFFAKLFPARIRKVTSVLFEYSPGRGNPEYTGDRSAFDVFVEYTNLKEKSGFLGIEVKYSETIHESKRNARDTFDKHKTRYTEISNNNDIFLPGAIDILKEATYQQIWRDHLLSLATLKDYEEGFFVYLCPAQNTNVHNRIQAYLKLMKVDDEEKTGFYIRSLEKFINTLVKVRSVDWTDELKARYLGEDVELT